MDRWTLCRVIVLCLLSGAMGPVPFTTVFASCNRMRAAVPMEIIQEKGEWRCIEVPGFLIYSRLPDANSRAFADELRRHNGQLATLCATTDHFRSTANQIPVVLRLLPQFGAMSGKNPSLPVQAYDDELSLLYVVYLPSVVPVGGAVPPGAPTPVLFPGVPMPAQPVELVSGPPTAAEMLARDAFARRMRYLLPKPPEWFLHGFERLMQETRIVGASLQLAPPMTRPAVPTGSIDEIFAADFANADDLQHEAWMRQSSLLLRWTLFAERERRDALWKFSARAARGPVKEAMFEAGFGMSYGELGVVLTDSRLRRGRIDGEGSATDMQLSEVRTGNEEEVARLIRTIEGLNQRVATHNAAMASAQ